jgi:hypothetical protein
MNHLKDARQHIGGHTAGSAQPEKLPEIPARLEELNHAINELREAAGRIIARVQPVSRGGVGSDDSPVEILASNTPIGGQIAVSIAQVRHQTDLLNEAFGNLGI